MDADVLIHAIIDAMLGALALSDIGTLFPDNKEEFKGISSVTLLKKVYDLILDKGYEINNIDSNIIVQEPKMMPYIPAMKSVLAKYLNIDTDLISIKAKTNEMMDAVGETRAIGGSMSHEFMVITTTDSGENDVFYCENCDYAANSDHAVSNLPEAVVDGQFMEAKIIDTPNTKSIEELVEFLKVPSTVILKTLVYIADKKPVLVLIRADKTVEETKLKNALKAKELRIAVAAEIEELMIEKGFEADKGFIGPVGMQGVWTVADESIKDMKNFVVGCNQKDKHLIGANFGIEVAQPKSFVDIRLVEQGEICTSCGSNLNVTRGIEVGNIFKLGTKYSKPMKAVFTDVDGKEKPYVMGCYGIGISRTAAAAVERYHDENGIIWPVSIAPYQVVIVPVNIKDELQMKVANELYTELLAKGIEAVLDDRDERPGVKFKDADLIGFPYRITVGKTIQEGLVEFKIRKNGEMTPINPADAINKLIEELK